MNQHKELIERLKSVETFLFKDHRTWNLAEHVTDAIHALTASTPPAPAGDGETASLREQLSRAEQLVAVMHAAAVGEVRGPIVGVVEDVVNLRTQYLRLAAPTAPTPAPAGEGNWFAVASARAAEFIAFAKEHSNENLGGYRGTLTAIIADAIEDARTPTPAAVSGKDNLTQ